MSAGSHRDRIERRLETLASGITDALDIDWANEESGAEEASDHVRALRLIAEVMDAYDTIETPPDPADPPLFTWGPLEVRALIGEGGFGEVYRAFDPRLQRSVALKLRRADAPGSARRWIDEARSLARVRHPNVLAVHGAEIHDDRAGIATELIDGTTLEDGLRDNGPVGAREAALIGVDLCMALAAVHGAGLVHGDVKAANVMRERGGRLVLMDFGSAHAGEGGAPTGTPLSTAPEVLQGHSATPRSDAFSLGVLLYRLVTDRHPYEAESVSELKRRHERDTPLALRSERPDLPAVFVQAVESALAIDPSERVDVVELERRLVAILAGSAASPQAGSSASSSSAPAVPPGALPGDASRRPTSTASIPSRPCARIVTRMESASLLAIPAVAILVLVLTLGNGGPSLISVQQSDLVRVVNATDHPLPPHAQLSVGDHLALRFAADEELHVYVLNEDATGETYILFPSPQVEPSNPLPGGRVHRLPGTKDGQSFDWVVSSAGGAETFLVVASREPLDFLDAEMQRMKTADADRPLSYAQLSEAGYEGLRGVGSMGPTHETGPALGGRLLDIASALEGSGADPGVWCRAFTVGPTPGSR